MKYLLSIITLFLLLFQGVFASNVITNVGKVQSTSGYTGTIPSGGESKGFIGQILSDIFDPVGKILSNYILAFQNILSVNNTIPVWNSSTRVFDVGSMIDTGAGVSIATSTLSSGLTLDVEGRIGGTEYCDEDGGNCFTAVSVGSGGGGFQLASVVFDGTDCPGNSCEILDGYNVSSVERLRAGVYRVNFSSPLIDTNYGAFAQFNNRLNSSSPLTIKHGDAEIMTTTTSYVDVVTGHDHQKGGVQDGARINVLILGHNGGGTGMDGGAGGNSPWTQTGSITYRLADNIGIGTTSPQTKLHVAGNTGIGRFDGGIQVDGLGAVSATNATHYSQYIDNTKYGAFAVRNGDGDVGAYFGRGNGGNRVNLNLSSGVDLNISGGNVGIGIPNPLAKLHVNGYVIANDPVLGHHVATKSYVDNNSGGASGTWCGFKMSNHGSPVQNCAGHDPQTSCPSGYTSKRIARMGGFGGDWYICVKN